MGTMYFLQTTLFHKCIQAHWYSPATTKTFYNPSFTTLNTRSLWANLLAGSCPESSRLSTLSRKLWQMFQLWVTILTSDSWKGINWCKCSVVKKLSSGKMKPFSVWDVSHYIFLNHSHACGETQAEGWSTSSCVCAPWLSIVGNEQQPHQPVTQHQVVYVLN